MYYNVFECFGGMYVVGAILFSGLMLAFAYLLTLEK